jgi:hypothetical protein
MPENLDRLVKDLGGQVEAAGVLPDGSGFATVSMPLPKGHWLTAESYNSTPPMPFRMGTDHPRHEEFKKAIWAAGKYALRSATNNGKIQDYDPDAVIQNLIVGLIGYHTPDGLSHDEDVPEFDPDPVPEIFK